MITVKYGPNTLPIATSGRTLNAVKIGVGQILNLPTDSVVLVNGLAAPPFLKLVAGDMLEFVCRRGRKGVGSRVWTADEYCEFFKVSQDILHEQIDAGLEVMRLPDGEIRITETAVDEFISGKITQSPYLGAEQAAGYLGISVKSLYGLVERRQITPLRGPKRTYRFTEDILHEYLGRKI